jgi:hypothetical protein
LIAFDFEDEDEYEDEDETKHELIPYLASVI